MNFILGLAIGVFVGACIGFIAAAIMSAAKRADEHEGIYDAQ